MSEVVPVNLRHLEGVAAIRRTRSFSAAATDINITQSALTQAIAGLEARVGCRLFDRSARGARATRAGDQLAESVERALHALNTAGEEVLPLARLRGPLHRRATGPQLKALAAVERAGSYRGGARAIGLSEASVHRAVRELEATLGVIFFEGDRLGAVATPEAVAIARAVRQAFAEIARGLEASRGASPMLVIGAMPLVRAAFLPRAVAAFCVDYPAVRIRTVEAPFVDLVAGLLDGEVDMLIGTLRERVPPGTVQHRLFDDDLTVVARRGHPLVHARDPSGEALAGFPWVASPPGTSRRHLWEMLMDSVGATPVLPQVESSAAGVICGLLLQGDWLAMLSPDQFRFERELGLLVPLDGERLKTKCPIGMTTREGWLPDPVQAAFFDVVKRCAPGRSTGRLATASNGDTAPGIGT